MENRLPLRYSDPDGKGYCEALMPSECFRGVEFTDKFRCNSGEIVRVHWCGTYNNEKGWCDNDLERLSQSLYGWSFARVRSSWIARLGKVEGYWYWIKLYKV